MADRDIRVVHYGLGPIGCGAVRIASRKRGIRTVGAVDVRPELIGKDVGEVADLDEQLGVSVHGTLAELMDGLACREGNSPADLCFHCTGSHLADVRDQLAEIMETGLNVVSTSEELSFPRIRHAEIATEIDALARANGVTVLGTGINPGFLMDTLPVVLTGMCEDVRKIRVTRVVDVSTRRRQLQAKVGTGLSVEEFHRRAETGRMGHIGLRESLLGIAEALGWPTEPVHHSLEPLVADEPTKTDHFDVPAGNVRGLQERTWIEHNGEAILCLELEMSVGASDPRDTIELDGPIPVTVRLDGVHGDVASQAVVVNSARQVVAAPPGLVTMFDLPPARVAA